MFASLRSAPWRCTSVAAQEIPRELRDVFATINDDKIPYNDSLIVVGNENAKVTAVIFYAQACTDTEYFLRNVFSDLKKDYIDTGKLRLVFYEYPLNWKDMQALAVSRPRQSGSTSARITFHLRNYLRYSIPAAILMRPSPWLLAFANSSAFYARRRKQLTH